MLQESLQLAVDGRRQPEGDLSSGELQSTLDWFVETFSEVGSRTSALKLRLKVYSGTLSESTAVMDLVPLRRNRKQHLCCPDCPSKRNLPFDVGRLGECS